jgi:hypothetical protein
MFGWSTFPSRIVSIETSIEFAHHALLSTVSTKPLKLDDIQGLCEQDTAQIKRHLQSIQDKEKTHIALAPSFAQVSWHLKRAEFMANILFNKIPHIKGAITKSGSSWLYWDHDLRANELVVLRIVSLDQFSAEEHRADVRLLLEAAIKEAAQWEIPKVFIWNPNKLCSEVVDELCGWDERHLLKATYEDRDNHIPSLRWRGDKSVEDVVWDYNEYYAWC